MSNLVKTILVKGLQFILIIILFWAIYLIIVFFVPTFPDTISQTLNLNNNINNVYEEEITLEPQSFGERIYNMFSNFKFPQPFSRD